MYFCLSRGTVGGDLSAEQFCKLAAVAGFQGADVDLGYGAEQGASALRDLYAKHRLKFGGWGAPDWRGDAAKAREGVESLPKLARIAKELGIDSCGTWIMPSSDLPFIDAWNFHVERIKPIARVLGDHGLRYALEFVAPYHLRRKFKHEFIFTPGLMLELAAAIGPNVGLLVDSYHCHASSTSWEHVSQIPREKIVLCHYNDCVNVPNHKIQDGERVMPGEGVIDLKAFFTALKTTGYSGPVSLEILNPKLRSVKAEDVASDGWRSTERVIKQAGLA